MKVFINQRLGERIMLFFLLAFAFFLPTQWVFIPITMALILFWLFWFITENQLSRAKLLLTNKLFWLFVAYYAWLGIAIFYSPDQNEGVREYVVQITMLLWPLALGAIQRLPSSHLNFIIRVFIIGSVFSSLLCIVLSGIQYFDANDSTVFFYSKLAHWEMVPMHYHGMYVSFAIILTIRELRFNEATFVGRILYSFGLLILLLFLGMLSVRIQFIALPLALMAYAAMAMPWKKVLLWFGAILLAVVFMVNFLDGPQRRFQETLDELASIDGIVNNKQTNHRIFIWKYGWEVISENVWLGTGTGSTDVTLKPKFEKSTAVFWNGYQPYRLDEFDYNYHNQFLQTLGNQGIIGLGLLLTIFIAAFSHAIKTKDATGIAFLVLLIISFMTESMLLRQAGALFFSFFMSIIFINRRSNKSHPTKKNKEEYAPISLQK